MKFSDIFWTTFKVRAAVKIQDTIINSVAETQKQRAISANLPEIIKELIENQHHFGSFMEKERKLIQVNKALANLEYMDQLTKEQKIIAREELLKLKNFLEN